MSTASLRPILRPSILPSLPSTSKSTTYICQSCRHARLLRRPKRPYTFTQLITLSDGSAFTIRTTSPMPVYRSTRDTRNSALWNPNNKDLLNVEDDEAGRLAGFRARFGKGFDLQRDIEIPAIEEAEQEQQGGRSQAPSSDMDVSSGGAPTGPFFRQPKEIQHAKGGPAAYDEYYEFEEDDANLLDLISSYGQEVKGPKEQEAKPAAAASKKGKK